MKKLLSLAVLLSISLSACGLFFDEKEAYLQSSKEVACLLMQTNNYDDPALEQKGREIFEKNGLDVSSVEAMSALDAKYKDDPDVQNAILEALKTCGGEMFNDEKLPETLPETKTETSDSAETLENTETTVSPDATEEVSSTEEGVSEDMQDAVNSETPEVSD